MLPADTERSDTGGGGRTESLPGERQVYLHAPCAPPGCVSVCVCVCFFHFTDCHRH